MMGERRPTVADAPWKRTERAIARRLGGQRVPVAGRARGAVPDVTHPAFAVEVKHRRRLPQWLRTAMAQAEAAARGGQVPIVVLHEAGQRYGSALVVLALADVARAMREG
jgi:hypothetical protein